MTEGLEFPEHAYGNRRVRTAHSSIALSVLRVLWVLVRVPLLAALLALEPLAPSAGDAAAALARHRGDTPSRDGADLVESVHSLIPGAQRGSVPRDLLPHLLAASTRKRLGRPATKAPHPGARREPLRYVRDLPRVSPAIRAGNRGATILRARK